MDHRARATSDSTSPGNLMTNIALIRAAVERGVTFFATAVAFTRGLSGREDSERLIDESFQVECSGAVAPPLDGDVEAVEGRRCHHGGTQIAGIIGCAAALGESAGQQGPPARLLFLLLGAQGSGLLDELARR